MLSQLVIFNDLICQPFWLYFLNFIVDMLRYDIHDESFFIHSNAMIQRTFLNRYLVHSKFY